MLEKEGTCESDMYETHLEICELFTDKVLQRLQNTLHLKELRSMMKYFILKEVAIQNHI